jgi:hypothetical protein
MYFILDLSCCRNGGEKEEKFAVNFNFRDHEFPFECAVRLPTPVNTRDLDHALTFFGLMLGSAHSIPMVSSQVYYILFHQCHMWLKSYWVGELKCLVFLS